MREMEEKERGWGGGAVMEERGRWRRPVGFNGEVFSSFESTPKGGEQHRASVPGEERSRWGEPDGVARRASANSGSASWRWHGCDD
jgi:hypothetical protein